MMLLVVGVSSDSVFLPCEEAPLHLVRLGNQLFYGLFFFSDSALWRPRRSCSGFRKSLDVRWCPVWLNKGCSGSEDGCSFFTLVTLSLTASMRLVMALNSF